MESLIASLEPMEARMKHEQSPAVFFNNCAERDHGAIYGKGAFFDLGTDGIQAGQATNLRPGQVCVVAAPTGDGKVTFDWYSLQRVQLCPDETGTKQRVFFGRLVKSESMSKAKAAGHRTYSVFFNINGHFKRQSSLRAV